jgi:hypothetical protein
MKILMMFLSCLCFSCAPSDKSDRLPDINKDNVTNNITITNTVQTPKRTSRINQPGPKHPAVEAAHEQARRRQEDDDFITCCCFIKIKKIPLH